MRTQHFFFPSPRRRAKVDEEEKRFFSSRGGTRSFNTVLVRNEVSHGSCPWRRQKREREKTDGRTRGAARAQEDAERAKRAYESAQGMHARAFEVVTMERASLEAATAEIEEKKRRFSGWRRFSGCWRGDGQDVRMPKRFFCCWLLKKKGGGEKKKKKTLLFLKLSLSLSLLSLLSLKTKKWPSEPTAWPASSGSCPRSRLQASRSGPSGTESAS